LTVADQSQGGLGLVDLILIEVDGLVETVGAGRLEAGLFELFHGVSFGFAQAFAAGVATFEGIVGKKFDVRPPRLAVEMGIGSLLLGGGGAGKAE
jgi:hypothetical protein